MDFGMASRGASLQFPFLGRVVEVVPRAVVVVPVVVVLDEMLVEVLAALVLLEFMHDARVPFCARGVKQSAE